MRHETELLKLSLHHNHSLSGHNTFGVDVRAAIFATPESIEEISSLLESCNPHQQPCLVLGEGSNVLFKNDFPGLIIKPRLKGIHLVEEDGSRVVVRVGAGENWDSWVQYATEKGWYGLENLSLIPGSVGSAPVQNIGAYGSELKDRMAWLEAWDLEKNQVVRLQREECGFGYRNSIFKSQDPGRYIITHVAFQLSRIPELNLSYGNLQSVFSEARGAGPMDLRNVIISIRRLKLPDPAEIGNAGSFFKNPVVDRTIFKCIRMEYPEVPSYPEAGSNVKVPAAWLIEKAGWKGKRKGNVGTWPGQPLVIVNYGGATGSEILDFSEQIRDDVDRKFGVYLDREVIVV